jgi:hypothetical protein
MRLEFQTLYLFTLKVEFYSFSYLAKKKKSKKFVHIIDSRRVILKKIIICEACEMCCVETWEEVISQVIARMQAKSFRSFRS